MRELIRFAFSVSFISLLAFLFIEWKVPGFVSYVFPVYWMVLIVAALGVASMLFPRSPSPHEGEGRGEVLVFAIAIILGIMLAEVVAKNGSVFGLMQAPLALIALITPPFLVWLSKIKTFD